MSEVIHITVPLTEETIRGLKAGNSVRISGAVFTARDAAHKRLLETLTVGGELPIPLAGQIIYYVGPAPARPGEVIGSAGPTTSTRMDSYTLPLLHQGLKGMIGKGSRSPEVRQGLTTHTAIYFAAVGGAAALIAASIKQVEFVAYEHLGTEAIYRLMVEDFPAVVANDCYGGDLYEMGKAAYRQKETAHEND
jgi:fumarate hydratase subunit beta